MKKKKVYLDYFLFPDIFVLLCIFVGIGGFVLLNGPITWLLFCYFIIGLVGYMISEYIHHRFIFHLKTPKNPILLKFLKRIHYDHHSDPNNMKLLFLPLWYSIPNILIFAVIFYVIESTLIGALWFTLGTVLMLLVYEWKHYVAHRPIKPKTKFGIWVKKLHLLHHFKNENYWYGVSTPFVDVLFGTLKDEKHVETSQTAKDLEKR